MPVTPDYVFETFYSSEPIRAQYVGWRFYQSETHVFYYLTYYDVVMSVPSILLGHTGVTTRLDLLNRIDMHFIAHKLRLLLDYLTPCVYPATDSETASSSDPTERSYLDLYPSLLPS